MPEGLAQGRIQGHYRPTGVRPAMLEALALAGAPVEPAMFDLPSPQ